MDIGIPLLLAFPPTLERSKEGLDASISRMSVECAGVVPAHQMFGLEPDALFSDRPPERDEGSSIDFTTGMSQLLNLRSLADLDPFDLIHATRLSVLQYRL